MAKVQSWEVSDSFWENVEPLIRSANTDPDNFFVELWRAGLAEYDDMEGIAWIWQSMDGAMVKAPLGKETVGRNSTDRGKKAASVICWWTPVASRYRLS